MFAWQCEKPQLKNNTEIKLKYPLEGNIAILSFCDIFASIRTRPVS